MTNDRSRDPAVVICPAGTGIAAVSHSSLKTRTVQTSPQVMEPALPDQVLVFSRARRPGPWPVEAAHPAWPPLGDRQS